MRKLIVGMSLTLSVQGFVETWADSTTECYLPLPTLQIDAFDNLKNEFGFQMPTEFDRFFSPNQSTIISSKYAIGADEIHHHQISGAVKAIGNVRVLSEDYQLDGDSVNLILDQEELTATNLHYRLFESDSDDASVRYSTGRGSAKLFVLQQGVFRLESADFTNCPDGNDDIVISASELTVDTENRQGIAKKSTVRFRGKPILVLPYVRFPVGKDRLTGFLYPKIGVSNRLGTSIEVPYYFNLAPHRDTTLTTAYYSKRGFQIQDEFRYLSVNSDWTFLGEYMPRDKGHINNDRRYGAQLTGKWYNGTDLFANVNASWVSDEDYLDDYAGVFSKQDPDYLKQKVELSYANDGLVVSTGTVRFLTSQPSEN